MTSLKSSKKKDLNGTLANKICKCFFGFFLGLISLILLTLILLPTIASSEFGKEKIEHYFGAKLDKHLTIDSLHFSIFGPQEIKGLKIKDESGNVEATLSNAVLETSFIKLLVSNVLEHPVNFIDLNMTLDDITGSNSPITLKNVNGEFVSETSDSLKVQMDGLSSQGNLEGDFHLSLLLKGLDAKNLNFSELKTEMLFATTTDLNLNIKATNFPVSLLDAFLSLKSENYKPHLLVSTVGEKLNLSLLTSKDLGENALTLDINASAPNLNVNISTKLTPEKLFLRAPSTAMFALSQELIDYFYENDLGFNLESPANVLVAVEELSLPFDLKAKKFNTSELMFKGRVDLNEAKFVSETDFPDVALQKFSAEIATHEKSEAFTLKIEGNATQNNQPINIAIETVLHKSLDFRKHKFPPLKINLTHIPIGLIDHLFGWNETLTKNIGSHADLKMEALVQKDHLDLNLEFDSDKISIPKMVLKIDDDLSMVKAPTLNFKLTEKFAKKVLPENAYLSLKTDEPLNVTFHLNPIENIYDVKDILGTTFSGILTVHNISLNIKETREAISFQEVVIPWEINAKTREAKLNFSGKTKHSHEHSTGSFSGLASLKEDGEYHLFDIALDQKNSSGHESKLSFAGSVGKLLADDGALNLYGMAVNLDAKITNLSTPLFCKVACLDKSMHDKIEVLFGKLLNADIHLRLKALDGLIRANVMGHDGSFHLDSQVQDGFLFLNQPFQAKFMVTPRLGESILQDIFPFLSGVVSSDQPILIAIAHEGFVFPLMQLDLSKIEIPQATLSLGHVKFDNSGELANVLSLLTPQNSDLISVWFTPLYLSMNEGVFKLERVDMLISHQFPIATWGKVDFISDKIKMKIGLSGYALKHAFKVKDLDNDYMVQIPLIGTTNSATIDKVNATTKIGALVAQGHGGPKGLVIGTVLSLAGGALTEEKPPKSTTIPLPWAEELKKSTEAKLKSVDDSRHEVSPVTVREVKLGTKVEAKHGAEISKADETQNTDEKLKKKKNKSKKFRLDKEFEHQAEQLLDGLYKSLN
jgi:hypothetical protein